MRRLRADRGDNPDPGKGSKISLTSNVRLDNEPNLDCGGLTGIDRHSVEFINEKGGGPGVRLRKRHQKKI
jgi:hypothetical protein